MNEIILAEDRGHAERAIDAFAADYAIKWPRAVAKVTDDRDALLTFFDAPAEHWLHLRTTNPIESAFAPVRTRVTKGPGTRDTGLAMVFKLLQAAQGRWRAVNGPHLVALVRAGRPLPAGGSGRTRGRTRRGGRMTPPPKDPEGLDEAELARIRQRADSATPGPWHVRLLDDDAAAKLVVVSTTPDTGRGERWPGFDPASIVAVTLVQFPERYADIADGRWDENAEFIAHVRHDIPRLLAEIHQLRQALNDQDSTTGPSRKAPHHPPSTRFDDINPIVSRWTFQDERDQMRYARQRRPQA